MNYTKHVSAKATPQSEPIPGKAQVQNSAGGFSFGIDKWQKFERFMILGSEGGSYYATEKKLTVENATNVLACIVEDGARVVRRLVEVSVGGNAPKNDPAIFALALAAANGNPATKAAAYAAIPKVCRIGTHLFHFCEAVNELRGWSRGLRNGVAKYYTGRTPASLGLDLIKYRQRDGWTHRDVLRLAHPATKATGIGPLLRYAVSKPTEAKDLPAIVQAFEEAQKLTASDVGRAVTLITAADLPREALPTELLNSKDVWAALLQKMPLTAMIRNLGKMTSIGLLTSNLDASVKRVTEALANVDAIRKQRVHPLTLLNALVVYRQGHGDKGKLAWNPVQSIVGALDQAFYDAFQTVEPTGKSFLLAIDCSGSMWGTPIAGTGLDCATASGAMALITAATEPSHEILYFSSGEAGTAPLKINPSMRLDQVLDVMRRVPWGGTDCAQPMLYATKKKLDVDAFVVYTDSETWAGDVHPTQALQEYRRKFNRPAKLVVVGLAANEFSVADPDDAGMLDVVGFDTAAPSVISQFAAQAAG